MRIDAIEFAIRKFDYISLNCYYDVYNYNIRCVPLDARNVRGQHLSLFNI